MKLTESGVAHYVVVRDGGAHGAVDVPEPSHVRAGLPDGYLGNLPVVVGSVAVTANVETGVVLRGGDGLSGNNGAGNDGGVLFVENERYAIFVFATDAMGNAQRLTTSVAVIMADDTPPSFRAGYPAAVEVDAGSFDILLGLDEASTAHYWVVEDADASSSPPSSSNSPPRAGAVYSHHHHIYAPQLRLFFHRSPPVRNAYFPRLSLKKSDYAVCE